jgi:hypothetical protein
MQTVIFFKCEMVPLGLKVHEIWAHAPNNYCMLGVFDNIVPAAAAAAAAPTTTIMRWGGKVNNFNGAAKTC